ncbi:hypothetical protein KSS87_023138 [Heliosperma pusillum]|nr:hypothetical protein KSS87_023138 [Heliosperma pusillum]
MFDAISENVDFSSLVDVPYVRSLVPFLHDNVNEMHEFSSSYEFCGDEKHVLDICSSHVSPPLMNLNVVDDDDDDEYMLNCEPSALTSSPHATCEIMNPSFIEFDDKGVMEDDKVEALSEITHVDDVFLMEEEGVDIGESFLDSCDVNPFDDKPCWDEHIEDSWEAQVDAIEAALNGSGSSYLEFCEFDLSENELVEIEAAFMDEMAKCEEENHGDDTFESVDLAFSSPLFYTPPCLQPFVTHTYGSFEDLNLPPPAHFEKRNDVVRDLASSYGLFLGCLFM